MGSSGAFDTYLFSAVPCVVGRLYLSKVGAVSIWEKKQGGGTSTQQSEFKKGVL